MNGRPNQRSFAVGPSTLRALAFRLLSPLAGVGTRHAVSGAMIAFRFASALRSPLAAVFVLTTAPALAQPAAPPSSDAQPVPSPASVRVELPALGRAAKLEVFVGEPPRSLEDRADAEEEDAAWKKVCDSPCTATLAPGTRLRVNGDFRESLGFTLPAGPSVRLAVDPARGALRGVGLGLTIPGAIFTTVGGFLTATRYRETPSPDHRGDRIPFGGAVALTAVGVALLTTGVVLLAQNWQTRVKLEPTPRAAPGIALGHGLWLTPQGMVF